VVTWWRGGELAVADLPAAWSELSQSLLGRAPSCHREGVLQDVHWSGGSFGYFPSYTLGNMMAAQLWYRAQTALPGLESDFESGNFARLLGWLRKEVHGRGRRYTLPQLAERVTGAPLSPAPLLRYLGERYLPLAS
jgi:carboxypeptidase Taq